MSLFTEKLLYSCSGPQWAKIGASSHVGINLPLSALWSKKSGGIGEFLDLLPLLSFCKELQMDVIQLLPLNDTGLDPSPYNALSSLALHPIYLSLYALPHLEDKNLIDEIENLQKLNRFKRVHFGEVLEKKMEILSRYFTLYGKILLKADTYHEFIQKNPWIQPYALFKALKKKFGNSLFETWPSQYQNISETRFNDLLKEHEEECSFYSVLQYLCFLQLSEVKLQSSQQKILIKGDIPILISKDSCDVWFTPHLFDLTLAAGAPPDQYSQEGQYWGFPIFNWENMRKENFAWWKMRLRYASSFYDIYRIDHTVGLFRLWAIPLDKSSREGFFIPRDETLWEPLGREILQMLITSSPMLPIAEDLGVVPNCVRPLLEELGICGTKVMRWERNWNTDRKFIDPKTYSPISMTCVSTHDSSFLSEWWSETQNEAKEYAAQKGWDYTPSLSPTYRREILRESVLSQSLFHINLFSEYLALVPDFVFENLKDERINIPGTISSLNWTYKFRKPLEEILTSSLLKEEIKALFRKN